MEKNHIKHSKLKNHSNNHRATYLKNSSQVLKTEIKALKLTLKQLKQTNLNLELQTYELKNDNQKNILDFQKKVKTLETQAQIKVDQIRQELNQKFESDKADIKAYSLQKFFETILDPFMKLKQTIDYGNQSQDANVKAYVVGFNMFMNQLLTEFKDFGLEEVVPQVGTEFDPEFHSVLSTVDNHKHHEIVEVKHNGFKLNNRVIKPAVVVVGK